MSAVPQACPQCREPVEPGDQFCENCGAELVTASADGSGEVAGDGASAGDRIAGDQIAGDRTTGEGPLADRSGAGPVRIDPPDLTRNSERCADCGGEVAPDGYCAQCGTPVPRPRDHWLERPAPWVAAICDRGVRHPHNEDAVAVAAAPAPGSFAALVVCDGVSSSRGSDVASLAAVRAARDVLVRVADLPAGPAGDPTAGPAGDPPPASGPDSGGAGPDPGGAGPDPEGTGPGTTDGTHARAGVLGAGIVEAGLQANAAVVACAGDPPGVSPPSCTFACAVLEDRLLVAGWVGDSRVYWLPDDGPAVQLSADDSWAGEAIAAGIVSREDAERAPQAHAITRWFGVDAPDPRARTAARLLDGDGWVLVCSDGLWNYCSPAAQVQGLLAQAVQRSGPDPGDLARELLAWAKLQGGHDNITVALARVK